MLSPKGATLSPRPPKTLAPYNNHLQSLALACGINNAGQIIGTAFTTDGHQRASLLTPSPPP
jgi:probable HAF family extracellular repeat protein